MIIFLLFCCVLMFILGAKIGTEITLTYLYGIGEITKELNKKLETWKGFKNIITEIYE